MQRRPAWREQEQLLVSVPGVGPVLATTLPADVPELGCLTPASGSRPCTPPPVSRIGLIELAQHGRPDAFRRVETGALEDVREQLVGASQVVDEVRRAVGTVLHAGSTTLGLPGKSSADPANQAMIPVIDGGGEVELDRHRPESRATLALPHVRVPLGGRTMTIRRALGALVLLAFLAVASAAAAIGPLDGLYPLTATAEGTDPYVLHLVVLQNGATVGIAFLDPFFGDYHYGFETLDAEQRLQGPLFFADGTEAGAFNLRFQGGSVEGSATLYNSPFAYSGAKAF
jgi:hypothetical protein